MKTKYLFTILVCFVFFGAKSQSKLNNYKYVIVPKKFDFLKSSDQYQLNSLTKFLFTKNKFNVYLDDENLPEDLFNNRCLGLYANVLENKSLFKTKLKVELKNCHNEVVFVTGEGTSREKNYIKAYHESIREAFQSFKSVNYSYSPKVMNNEESSLDIEPIRPAIKEYIPEPEKVEIPKEVKTDSNQDSLLQVTPNTEEIAVTNIDKKTENKVPLTNQISTFDVLYAQTINNGFQLVDRTPKVVYTIYNSGKKDFYIVKGKDAVIYKLKDIWVISEIVDESLKTESLNIKF